ncbi:MAG: hypothetical protein GX128_04235 [Bacteroidales bacterium]|jgi:uncharacterized protein YfaS (alpha-2-macroglobulin family)|nr:hypothetical protein [Bacteroidales bacterium]
MPSILTLIAMKIPKGNLYSLLILTAIVFCFSTCVQPAKDKIPPFHPLVSAYTSGTISGQSYIRVVLSENYPGAHTADTLVGRKVFKFKPSIEGEAFWVDSRTIEFRPAKTLPSSTVYQASFLLLELPEIASDIKSFDFSFRTIRQGFLSEIEGLVSKHKNRNDLYALHGVLRTADFVEPMTVEKMLEAQTANTSYPVIWEHDAGGHVHRFEIDSIPRLASDYTFKLNWNGKPLNISTQETDEVNIPAKDVFSVIDITVKNLPEQKAIIRFSDPIDEKQDFNGLISLIEQKEQKKHKDISVTVNHNVIIVNPLSQTEGDFVLSVEAALKNFEGRRLNNEISKVIYFNHARPEVSIPGKGVILPGSEGLVLPFRAISLRAVEMRVVKLFEQNIPFFLQINDLGDSGELKRAGRLILKKTILLNQQELLDLNRWNTFSLDLADMIQPDPGAIYRIELSFKRIHSTFPCAESNSLPSQSELDAIDKADFEKESQTYDDASYWYYSDYYYEYDDYDYVDYETWYQRRNDPCYPQYYNRDKSVRRNILASDLGIIAKQGGDGKLFVLVSDLITTRPMQNVVTEVYNYQNQLIAEGRTNDQGMAVLEPDGKPFLLIAKQDKQRSYLKLSENVALSVSNFDVSGDVVQQGLKGFIYGERGVWRPGDTLFLSFILEDKNNILPADHPVNFELLNPLGQIHDRITKAQGNNGFYTFITRTAHDAPTGNWTAVVKVGGAEFKQRIKIESIKPNRLKIDLDFDRHILTHQPATRATLKAEWLHGAAAHNLRADVNLRLSPVKTRFKGWETYTFDDPEKIFASEEKTVFNNKLDERGIATFNIELAKITNAPGMLKAFFTTRVFEGGGEFSIDGIEKQFSPYTAYAGIKTPEMNRYRMLDTDREYKIQIASLFADGSPVNNRKLDIEVYKIDWNWWWNAYEHNIAQYMRQYEVKPYYTKTATVQDGKGSFSLKIPDNDWGRFYVKVSDPVSGHSTGEMWFFDWPSTAGRPKRSVADGATMLTFTTDQEKYKPGDRAKITFPSSEGGSAIISIENGTRVIDIFRVNTKDNETTAELSITHEMIPNAYIHISLIQPHSQTVNDLPVRLYGILPIMVDDPSTHLQPVISMPDVLEPEKPFKITVFEETGKEMTYTLAIVDEGLLSLTRFKTPDPWEKFFAREALGVRSWDIYDYVIGAFGGKFEQLFSIGGDEFVFAEDANLANRFKPVVKFLGPFTIKPKQKQEINIELPQYIGSVRTMVVAGNRQAYGFAHKQTPVRKSLMVLATMPRVLGPNETFSLPVTVFSMDSKQRNVTVNVQVNDMFAGRVESKNIEFSNSGDKTVFFELKTANRAGIGKINVTAISGNETASHDIEIGVRNPNTEQVITRNMLLESSKNGTLDYAFFGLPGTNSLWMELSTMPPIDLTSRLKYLLGYPHGCLEQITSIAFPQLFLGHLTNLDEAEKQRTENNIKAALSRLKSFQLPDGSFSTWAGGRFTDEWATTYAGHFMLEAEALGYALPPGVKKQWLGYQQVAARAWGKTTKSTRYAYSQPDLVQAYRLFTLTMAKSPETGAMNRLRERTDLSVAASWRLAAAYALIGQKKISNNIINGLDSKVKEYTELSETYGSATRDRAMILETLVYLNERQKAFELLKEVSQALSSGLWMSTQTTAYSLIAVSKYKAGETTSHSIKASYSLDNAKPVAVKANNTISEVSLISAKESGSILVQNDINAPLYVRLFTKGIPAPGDEIASENNIRVSVRYLGLEGGEIDVRRIKSGTDFIAEVTVSNLATNSQLSDLILNQIFPSGWEIRNQRLFDMETTKSSSFLHQDIRDDRVLTYFDLGVNQKKVFKISLMAAYAGHFYLPAPSVEAMYNQNIHSYDKGMWVEVIR